MISKKIINYLIGLTLIILFSPLLSFGQDIPSSSNFLQIKITPEKPEPLQNVTVSIVSYVYDLDRARITWSVNNVEKRNEIGLKEFSFQVGKSGQEMTIKATADVKNEGLKEAEISFTPAVVDVIYEAKAYTPPFYKGRALNPNQGTILVNAIPELIKSTGEKVSNQNIIFSWKKDGKVMQSASGLGKSFFSFDGTVPIRDYLIEVSVSSLEGGVSAYKQTTIKNIFPKIIFYENSPVYGIMFNKAIVNIVKMLSDEFSVIAIPYFYSVGYINSGDLDYVWTMNGLQVGNQAPKNSFTTRVDAPGAGSAEIGLKISNNARIFQFVQNNYQLSFEKQ